jgi:SEC-C motif/Tetratricopeptide repeat
MTAVAQRPIARNDPCPCGSGRRYKDCHGSLRSTEPAAVAALVAKSRYRPGGNDWASIGEEDQDRLGALMERALVEQKAGRVRDAERLYRAVLEEAPLTHDALHMLGVVRLGLGDFTDAERLIREAMALRPPYPAITTNWSLVQRSIAARDRSGIETVSEHALPLLLESLVAARPRAIESAVPGSAPLHVVGPALDVAGDATWLAQRLRTLLAPLDAQFWNLPASAGDGEWRRLDNGQIDVTTAHRPRSGVVVLAGLDDDGDGWLREPIDRVLVFVQRASPSIYLERLRRIAADGARALTLVFDSHARARRFGGTHAVVPPPIDVAQWPLGVCRDARERGVLRIAAVGQDRRRVEIADDADHLRAIADAAGRLDLFDPGPLREAVGASRSIACFPGNPHDHASALAQCDVYLHRTIPWWTEDPRMLFGAMLSRLAVLCPRGSAYAEYLSDGVDGWLYDDYPHALQIVATLRAEPERVTAAGNAARQTALARFEPSALAAAYTSVVDGWMRNR